MKVALVTTPPQRRSGIGDYTRDLLPHLAKHVEVQVFVEDGLHGEDLAGCLTRPLSELDPSAVDRILYQLGNERGHGFMLPALRKWGGTVVLHDWVLFDLAMGGVPGLERGGWRGHLAALKTGGLRAAKTYGRIQSARRSQRSLPARLQDLASRDRDAVGSSLLEGWHAWEGNGRWSSDWSLLGLGTTGPGTLEIEVDLPAGRTLELLGAQGPLGSLKRAGAGTLCVDLPAGTSSVLGLRVAPVDPTPEQRQSADARSLGAFVRAIRFRGTGETRELDLTGPATELVGGSEFRDVRFELPLNRPVVRMADAFIVHSDWMRTQILDQRNAPTPIGLLPHGSTQGEVELDSVAARQALGLPAGDLIITSFGAIQEHKRPEPLLRAFAQARALASELHLVLAGEDRLERLDLRALTSELGIEAAVTVTGFLEERNVTQHLAAADVCVNLRGPSTGGTSGAIARALGVGRPVITSDCGEQAEWPADCVQRVPVDGEEVACLRDAIIGLAQDPEQRRKAQLAARRFVRDVSNWERVGRCYAEFLAQLPAHRAAAKSLIDEAVKAADERRRQRSEGTT